MQKEIYKIFSSWTTYDEKMINEWNKLNEECNLSDIKIHEIYVDETNEYILKRFRIENLPCIVFNKRNDEENYDSYVSVSGITTYDMLKKLVENLIK